MNIRLAFERELPDGFDVTKCLEYKFTERFNLPDDLRRVLAEMDWCNRFVRNPGYLPYWQLLGQRLHEYGEVKFQEAIKSIQEDRQQKKAQREATEALIESAKSKLTQDELLALTL